ncbi:hypothetical protein KPL71_024440 [Citrus sinensis]|uniref:Uncharacterized protein n=1 Tax=Citrus sinensis TaxID=2711 RepID=A0ACB8IRF9_CITSI|nr:hypothetical protein KPL71_024440 [Citrus sinensis]
MHVIAVRGNLIQFIKSVTQRVNKLCNLDLANCSCSSVCELSVSLNSCVKLILSGFVLQSVQLGKSISEILGSDCVLHSYEQIHSLPISAQPYQCNTTISVPSHPASVASPTVPTLQIPSPPLSAHTPLMPPIDTSESGNGTPNLVKPSLFFVPPPSSSAPMMQPVSSSTPTAPPLNPPLSL